MSEQMHQTAPWPDTLFDLVAHTTYRPGWVLRLHGNLDRGQGSEGLTLVVDAAVQDSRSGYALRVHHFFPVPPAAYNERSWRHWLFARLLEVEAHEAAEFFVIKHTVEGGYVMSDGSHADSYDERPFAPLHAPGNDPYMQVEATYEEAHTSSNGQFTDQR